MLVSLFFFSDIQSDQKKKLQAALTMTFTDFLEAFCRVAYTKIFPTADDLEECGCINLQEFLVFRSDPKVHSDPDFEYGDRNCELQKQISQLIAIMEHAQKATISSQARDGQQDN